MRPILLALLVGSAASAQPTAADSALVGRVILALGYDLEGDAEIWGPPGPFDPGVMVRDAFLEDVDTARLEAALVVLEGAAWTAIEGPPGVRTRPTGPGALADSALVAEYVAARHHAQSPPGLWPAVVEQERQTLSEANLDAIATLSLWKDQTLWEYMLTWEHEPDLTTAAAVSRRLLSAVAPSDLEVVTAFYRSDLGRYVGRLVALGLNRASARDTIATMLQIQQTSTEAP